MPNLQDSEASSFSILKFTNLPLALVSFLSVLEVIVNGLKVVVVSDCCGYRFTPIVTFALPASVLKSGTNLRKARNTSPAIVGPDALPCDFVL